MLERARFFEQMGRARHDVDLAFAFHLRTSLFVELDDHVVFAADNEQRRRFYFRQCVACEIRPAAARNDRANFLRQFRGRDQGSATAGA